MKRKGLFITVLSTMLLGVGVFAGVSSVSENAPVEKAEAWSGSTTDSSLYIYFTRPSDWGNNGIRIHTWNENGPGTKWESAWLMTFMYNNEYGQSVFGWHPSSSEPLYENIIFHNNNNGMQSATLPAPQTSKHYYYNDGWQNMNPETQRIYLYDYDNKFQNGAVKAHCWKSSNSDFTTQWSGVLMTVTAESAGNNRIYYADVHKSYDRVIFNVNGDANKTAEISGMYNNGVYVLANGSTQLDGKNTWWNNINYAWAHNFSQNIMNFRTTSASAGEGKDTGYCTSGSVYNNAKTAYNAIKTNTYALNELKTSFPAAIERLGKWAIANGETFNSNSGTFSSRAALDSVSIENTNLSAMTLAVVAFVSIAAGVGFLFFKKKKSI